MRVQRKCKITPYIGTVADIDVGDHVYVTQIYTEIPMGKPKITIALSHYDRHVPFFDGTVQAEGVDLNVLIVGQSDRQRDGEERHERMLQKGEFDVAELSLSSYLMAKSRGMQARGKAEKMGGKLQKKASDAVEDMEED